MKIVILDGHAVNPGDLSWDCFKAFGDVTVYEYTEEHQILERIGNAEIVLTNKTPLTGETFAACPSIQLVCVLATGYNVVDCEAARKITAPLRWRNLPFLCCWSFAIGWVTTMKPSTEGIGQTAPISVFGIPLKWSWPARP